MKGIGIYWCLIEIIHEQNGVITFEEVNSISFELQEEENNILSVIKEFDLFVIHMNEIRNTRVLDSLEERHKTSARNTKAVNLRWGKQKVKNQQVNTRVLPKSYTRNTIREEKRIENNIYIPSKEEFLEYCFLRLSTDFQKYKFAIEKKYEAWIESKWHDGNGKKIKNWKTTILNTIPFLKAQEVKNSNHSGLTAN